MINLHLSVQEFNRAAEKCQLEIVLGSVEPVEFCDTIANLIFCERKLKSVKKPLKNILLALQSSNATELESCIRQNLDKLTDGPVPDIAIQFLLENCAFLHGSFSPYVQKLVQLCTESIIVDKENDNGSRGQDVFCGRLKTVLEIIQFLRKEVERCFKDNDVTSFHLVQVSQKCIEVLGKTKEYNDATRAMAGIYLGNFLNYCTEDNTIASIILYMCANITQLPVSSPCLPAHGIFATIASAPRESTEERNYVHLVFLLKGLFSCTRSSAFYAHLSDYGTLLHILFSEICEASELQGELQYHGLQVLKLWWTKVLCALKKNEYASCVKDIVSEEKKFVKLTMDLIFRQWDSPISGVPAIVLDVLTLLIDIQQMIGVEERFLNSLLEKLMLMPSSIKGKYNCIILLNSRMGAKTILQKYPHFINEMKPLLAVNHLCPVISKTYRAIIADVAKQKNDELWRKTLLPELVAVLVDSKHLIRSNAAIYWLPIHLKAVRGCYHDIINAIHDQASSLDDINLKYMALIATSKFARKENLINFNDLNLNLIESCLSNFDDTVRSEAFQVVCCNAKSSERILLQEMDVIRRYLPLNMSSDSAIFRQQLVYCARCLCERIHDSMYPAIKATLSSKKNPEDLNYVEVCQTFLQFILETCLDSIHPEFTYQRKKTALDIYGMMLNTFFDHFRNIPATEVLYKDDKSAILMDMLRDSVPELRLTASQLLGKYFSHLPAIVLDRYSAMAARLSRSPRAQDNESAAAIFDIVLRQSNSSSHSSLFQHFVSQVKQDVEIMKANIAKSSYEAPVHGWLLVVDKCICSLGSDFILQNSQPLLDDLCSTVCEVINLTIAKVFGFVTQPSINCEDYYLGISADFCEMTERIENLALGVGKNHKNILLSDDHEAILAASWLCLLRGTALLATIASVVSRSNDGEKLLSDILNSMVLVLTSCRHRGAIEGCYEAFLTVCRLLLNSKVESYQQIPQNVIKRVCDSLETVTESNVTRRSAGIPLVVEAILVAESFSKSSELFGYVVDRITALSSQVPSLDQSKDEKYDFPQVHGLYVLKHIFRNAQLGSSVLCVSASVFEISIKCLSSSIWVVRNAATHLFGAVANRMLGQKNVDGSHMESLENSVSSGDFFCRFPSIGRILKKEMTKSLPSNALPNPGLHPMLCLLSKLVYCDNDQKYIPEELVEIVTKFLDSPVYSIRCMAAKSLLGLVGDKVVFVNKLFDRISDRLGISNSLHGLLVLIQEAMKNDERIMESVFIHSKLFTLWKTQSLHPINACIVVNILRNSKSFMNERGSEFLNKISAELTSSGSQVGRDEYQYQLIKTRSDLSAEKPLKLPLQGRDGSRLLKAALQQIPDYDGDDDLVICLLNCIQDDNHHAVNKIVEVLLNRGDVVRMFHSIPDSIFNQLLKIASNMISTQKALSLRCVGLKLLSLMILAYDALQYNHTKENLELDSTVAAWIHHVTSRTSNYKASEPLRLSAAESINIAGCNVFKHVLSKAEHLANFVCAILSLLHDEQSIIRQWTCSFVIKLTQCEGSGILYHTSAAKKFLCFFFDTVPLNDSAFETIVIEIFKLKGKALSHKHHSVLFDREPFNLYEEPYEIAQMVADAFLDYGVSKMDQLLLDKISKKLIRMVNEAFHKSSGILHDLIHLKCVQMAVKLPTSTLSGYQPASDFCRYLEQLYECPRTHVILRQEIQYTLQICGAKF